MVNRINKEKQLKGDTPTGQNTTSRSKYISENNLKIPFAKDRPRFDDLIVTLANAYENRRAAQVTKWEQMREPGFSLSV